MTDDSKRPWKEYYEAALVETDRAKLPGRIADADTAVKNRIKELSSYPFSEEHWALLSAVRFLRILEMEVSERRKAA